MEQLELWGVMRCRIDISNKQYKVYRLKHMAKTMETEGRDVFYSVLGSTAPL
jgi:hypothetical protein